MHICLHLDDVIIPWESTNRADFVAQSFFWILGYNTRLLSSYVQPTAHMRPSRCFVRPSLSFRFSTSSAHSGLERFQFQY